MPNLIARYTHWLHTRWPAGHVEKLPVVRDDGTTNVPGLFVVGDLRGVPLLKLSADSGARAVQQIAEDPSLGKRRGDDEDEIYDIAIIGGGVSGFAAALEAKNRNLRFVLFEASEPFSTIVNFPKAKPIYTYPTEMTPAGDLQFHDKSDVKEGLLEDLREQTLEQGINPTYEHVETVRRARGGFQIRTKADDGEKTYSARRVIVGIGRSGNYRRLGVPGEDLDKVYHRLYDPSDHCGQNVLIVGGGDSAMETAIALATCGAHVTLSYRKGEFSRPKPENLEKVLALAENPQTAADVDEPSSERVTTASGDFMGADRPRGTLTLMMSSNVREIRENEVDIEDEHGGIRTLGNDVVFAMIGREAPLDFFRRAGVKVAGDRGAWWWTSLIAFVIFCFWLYHWKGQKAIPLLGKLPAWLDPRPVAWISGLQNALGEWAASPASPIGVLLNSAKGPAFYYTLAYSLIVVIFGWRRIRRRRTPYITWQTITLAAIQVIPLFLLPELILPWLDGLGFFEQTGLGRWLESTLFPGGSWWRAYGLILAWPLFVYNFFTSEPIWGWLVLGSLQTFVIIPLLIWRWGKGAYCGWICSCGALAETLGDMHRHKMPHGPAWNRLNMLGQVILLIAGLLMILRILGWAGVDWAARIFASGFGGIPLLNYAWSVDLLLAGVLGYGLYFWFSGRMWCRFACPLAALMHVYARFSRFRILADKKKCISCNVCTSVCHQGIDIMNFANKGLPMEDPQCVRCSACVQSCPTGVLTFGRINRRTGEVLGTDRLAASPVQMAEMSVEGKRLEA
ncbi:MAG: NAD(P)-binding domain-containing protein [Planctomycetota bacterium]|nr:NAD(P)-binding domain-containing protein [Planctomycetota bacterium]